MYVCSINGIAYILNKAVQNLLAATAASYRGKLTTPKSDMNECNN